MPVQQYDITKDNCTTQELFGFTIEVETRSYPGFTLDHCRLLEWSLNIATSVIAHEIDHIELLEESVHVRITSAQGNVIVDTISDRTKRIAT